MAAEQPRKAEKRYGAPILSHQGLLGEMCSTTQTVVKQSFKPKYLPFNELLLRGFHILELANLS